MKGASCTAGQSSPPVGTVIDGHGDTPGPNGNEVNNVYYITYATGSNAGSSAGYLGDFITTFNEEYWYEPPVTIPGTTSPIFVNMGNISIYPNASMTSSTWVNLINQALGGQQNGGLSPAARTAVQNYVNNAKSAIGNSGTATIVDCFDAPWDGKA